MVKNDGSTAPKPVSVALIYLARVPAGEIRIGWTTKLDKQIAKLQRGVDGPIEVVATAKVENARAHVERPRWGGGPRMGDGWFQVSEERFQQIKTYIEELSRAAEEGAELPLPSCFDPKPRPISPDDHPYLHDLKAFVEGSKDWREWRSWWDANRDIVAQHEEPDRLELIRPIPNADLVHCVVLGHGIECYREQEITRDPYWKYCLVCHEPMFMALPGVTTQDEIREFASRCKLAGAEDFARSGWIHPGVYCPNGCTGARWHFG